MNIFLFLKINSLLFHGRNNHFDAVEQIATELTSENDSDLLTRCAQYFIDQHHYEKAVHLLAVAKQVL